MTARRQAFEDQGFVLIPDFLDREACAALRAAADAIVDRFDLAAIQTVFDTRAQSHGQDTWFLDSGPEVRPLLEASQLDGKGVVNKLGHALHEREPAFRALSNDPRLPALLAELRPAMDPLLLQSMVIFKHPQVGGEVTAHQDATYLVTEPASVLGMWFALDDADGDNGCLEVLVGGHRLGLRRRMHRQGYRTWTETYDPSPWPSDGWRPLPVAAGSLIVFDGLLPHRSEPNLSSRPRYAYTLHLIDAHATYAADNWLQRPADMPLHGFERDWAD
ncbi:MAG: phytanoyl-CoA dioxygenase family protein [Myxococcales bacterium]|nr:phytanoyl-CoA dioxygenase family protein [Myxococcales bacterium]